MSNESFTWDLREHGDLLEFEASDFVRDHLQAYESTWSIYIGHTGSGLPANLLSVNGNVIPPNHPLWIQRQRFAQYHYTVLESLYSLSKLELNPGNQETLTYDGSYLKVSEQVLLFHALIGRTADCLTRAGEKIGLILDSENNSLSELYDPRNIILHGPRIPFNWYTSTTTEDQYILDPSSGEWDDKNSLWTNSYRTTSYKKIGTYISEKRNQAIETAGRILWKLNSIVQIRMKENKISLEAPLATTYQQFGRSGAFSSSLNNTTIVELPSRGISGVRGKPEVNGKPGVHGNINIQPAKRGSSPDYR